MVNKEIQRIQLTSIQYPAEIFEAWKFGDHSFLMQSDASDYIKRILSQKATRRPGRRFFGEAFIASQMKMTGGWYSSYKWLSSKKWLSGKGLEPQFKKPFQTALLKHFGEKTILGLQKKTKQFFRNHNKLLFDCGRYKKPVAPDLWLILPDGRHLFIESKLPDDCLKSSQLAGLALIKKYLGPTQKVSISVISLFQEGSRPPKSDGTLDAFEHFYALA
jgi:hypothetical protein